jgi:protoheme IX farnesyltransferase
MNTKSIFASYLELTKPRILTMVLVTTTIGFFLGGHGIYSFSLLFYTLLGTGLTTGGAAVLNHYLERDVDAKMDRTKNRPLPTGKIQPISAFAFGVVLVLCGAVVLFFLVNLLTAYLNLMAAFLYVLVYTPMKRLSWFNTFVGAIPGAIPPMAGWTAAANHLDIGAWILFLILFTWQHPHFFAIAWMYKEDYRKGGFIMLPVIDETGKRTISRVILYSVLMIAVSLTLTFYHVTGQVYLVGALALGLMMLGAGIMMARSRSVVDARRLLRASIIYLPLLLILIVVDSRF